MTARSPRRTRRQAVPAAALPRPLAGSEPPDLIVRTADATPRPEGAPRIDAGLQAVAGHASRRSLGGRAHHVTADYSYVHRDLLTVAAIGAVVLAFIVGMSFVV